jgi:dienelactone hydrolase
MRQRHSRPALAIVLCVLLAPALIGQSGPTKRPISHDAYDSWRSIQNTALTSDGAWLVYALVPQDGDGEVVARNLRTGEERRHPRGKDPVVTADNRFVVFTIAPAKAEVDAAKKAKKKPEDQPKNGLGILDLSTGAVSTADRVKSFKVAKDAGRFVAYLLEPPTGRASGTPEAKAESKEPAEPAAGKKEKKKDPGTELIVRELSTGTTANVAEVTEYAWSNDGAWLAYAVSSKTPDNDGVFVRATAGTTTPIMKGLGAYKSLAFDDGSRQLAFVSNRDQYQADPAPFALYYWRASEPSAAALVTTTTSGLPKGFAVSENGQLSFTRDGTRLLMGTAPIAAPEVTDGPEPVKVDLWHFQDPLLQPMQKVRADQERRRSYRGLVHLSSRKFVQLADVDMPAVEFSSENAAIALGTSDVPYRRLTSWDTGYSDVFTVNLDTGARQKILEKLGTDASLSPNGRYVIFFDDEQNAWFTQRVGETRRVNLTGSLSVKFEDELHDSPGEPRAYGVAGWTPDDRSVLLYDRFDIWEIRPDGTGARMITQGAGRRDGVVFRYQRLDPDLRAIPATEPILLDAVDDRTKASGFYRVSLAANAPPAKLMMVDKSVGNPIKAKKADVVAFTMSRFEEFPNVWTTDLSFANPRKVTDANPQQQQFNWGRSELIEYVNADGKTLKAVLTKPEDFDPTKKYPLMVYIYEELSSGLHRYRAPSPGTSVNVTRYVSNGYIVLEPDIVYDNGYPGQSAEKCVIPAVHKVLSMGYVDPARVGIQGHSWGGYQITYLITRTNIFRAVEAGASVVNMVSAYGGIRWGTGMSRAFQYEKTQSRIGGPPWQYPLQFIENSPIFWVEKVNTPYLTIHNDEDDAVPWYQGIEWINAMRRLGKEAYMFTYNGEKHGLRDRENQKHWTVHMAEFFDHHLKGAPKPEWMEKGVPFLERGKRDLSPFYGKKTTDWP